MPWWALLIWKFTFNRELQGELRSRVLLSLPSPIPYTNPYFELAFPLRNSIPAWCKVFPLL